jgi:hypothetical protein
LTQRKAGSVSMALCRRFESSVTGATGTIRTGG